VKELLAALLALLARGDGGRAVVTLGVWVDQEPERAALPEARFAGELLALARCEPVVDLSRPRRGEGPWDLARAHVALERLRLGHARPDWALALSWRSPPAPTGDLLRWPGGSERWSDEQPVVTVPAGRCRESFFDDGVREAEAIEALLAAAPPDLPTRGALALERGLLFEWRGQPAAAERLVAAIDEATLDDDERHQRNALLALSAEQLGRSSPRLWSRARDPERPDIYVDAHLVAVALLQGDLAGAALARTVAESRAGEGDWFASRAAVAAFRLEDEAGFFALARRLLARRPRAEVADDPLLAEVAELAALRLSAHAWDEHAIELAESLGPPNQLADRIEEAAEAALRGGRPAFALGAWRWLVDHRKSRFLEARVRGRLTVALALAGDAAGFRAAFDELATRALGQDPRRKHPLEWDRQLLLATRDLLPLLAEPPEPALLAPAVATLSRYLRQAGRERSYAELTDLYRVLSAQLPLSRGARPYAEKLGARRVPILLGELELARRRPPVPPPDDLPPPTLRGPHSLLCLPQDGRCRRWAGPVVPGSQKEVARP
jgi:hypothetical protein